MNKQDYLEELNRLDEIQTKTQLVKDLLVREFKLECKHEPEFIDIKTDYHEDEFGRYQPSWDTYTYTCKNCSSQLYQNKVQFKTWVEVQEALSAKIRKEYLL